MPNKSISVIIPNFNGRHLLEKNLPSVIDALENAAAEYEIIVVDDHSVDDSVQFVRNSYPQIKIIESPANQGFSTTCNKGIFAAKNDLVLLLNTDIQLTPQYFEGKFKYFEKADTFGVMCKIVGVDGEVQDTARKFTRRFFKIKANTFYYVDDPDFWTPTAYLSGANALIDTHKLKAIGGFDEIFSPFYYEDFDLGLRAWRLGWKCYYHHFSHCIHDTSSTTKNYRTSNWVKAVFARNKLIMHAIHLKKSLRLLYYVQIGFNLLFMWIGLNFFVYKGLYQFLSKLDAIKKSRRNMADLMQRYNSKKDIGDVINDINRMLLPAIVVYQSKEKQ